VDHRGRTSRPFRNHGSPFRKVAAVFPLPGGADSPPMGLTLAFQARSELSVDIRIAAFAGSRRSSSAAVTIRGATWEQIDVPLRFDADVRPAAPVGGTYGT